MKTPLYNNRGFVPFNGTNGNFGVDKLKLFTTDYHVSDITPWNITPNTKKAGQLVAEETPLMVCNDELIHGVKAYINTEAYSATIQRNMISVEFNPSKHYHPTDLVTDPNRIAEVMQSIQTDLKENHRTEVNLFSTGIGRIDITAQAQMEHLVQDYKDLINNGRSTKKYDAEYPNGILTGNSLRQICTYDKGMKLAKDRGINHPPPTNFQRLETRLLKAEAVQAHSEFRYVSHLLNSNNAQLHKAYSKGINYFLKMGQAEISFVEMNTLTELMRNTIQSTPKRGQWFPLLLIVLGGNLPDPKQFTEALKRLCDDNVISRNNYNQYIRKYTEQKHQAEFMKNRYFQDTANSYESRFKEFTEKLILPYRTA